VDVFRRLPGPPAALFQIPEEELPLVFREEDTEDKMDPRRRSGRIQYG
jgi:hypothetical protein